MTTTVIQDDDRAAARRRAGTMGADRARRPYPFILIDAMALGGPGRGLLQLAHGLKRDGLDFELNNFSLRREGRREFDIEMEKSGVTVTRLEQRGRFDVVSPVLESRRRILRLGCNVIQTHGYKAHTVGYLVSRMLNLPWLGVAHGWTSETRRMSLYRQLDLRLLKSASMVMCVSPVLQRQLESLRGPGRSTLYLPNAVDPDLIPGSPGGREFCREDWAKPGDCVIGVFGRLSPEKGHEIFLNAFAAAARRSPKMRCVIVGDGPEKQRLCALVSSRGLGDAVSFVGHTQFIKDYFAGIDFLCLPSLSEGMPNVVLEAMALGRPVVATDVGAVRELIKDGHSGMIVNPGDEAALADALVTMASDSDRRALFAARAGSDVRAEYSVEARLSKFLSSYDALLREGGAG